MAWENGLRDPTREWTRPQKGVPLGGYAPLWLRQSILCLFIFFLVLGHMVIWGALDEKRSA